MRRRSVLLLAILLMVAGLFLSIRRANRPVDSEAAREKSSPLGFNVAPVNAQGGLSERRGREAVGKSWRYAEEKIEEGSSEPSGDFPVYLGYLQSDGTNQEMRIGLRQEAGAELDVADLEITVNLLDAGGNLLESEAAPKIDIVKDKDEFSESQAPVIRVSSGVRVDGVGLTLRYRGKEVERRRYVLAAPVPEIPSEQGGGND